MRNRSGQASGHCQLLRLQQGRLCAAALGHVRDHDDAAGQVAGTVVDGCLTALDEVFGAVGPHQDCRGWQSICGLALHAEGVCSRSGELGRSNGLVCQFIHQGEYELHMAVGRGSLCPAGEPLGGGVEQLDAPVLVADYDTLTDGGQRSAQPLLGLIGCLRRAPQGLHRVLVRVRDHVHAAVGEQAKHQSPEEGEDDHRLHSADDFMLPLVGQCRALRLLAGQQACFNAVDLLHVATVQVVHMGVVQGVVGAGGLDRGCRHLVRPALMQVDQFIDRPGLLGFLAGFRRGELAAQLLQVLQQRVERKLVGCQIRVFEGALELMDTGLLIGGERDKQCNGGDVLIGDADPLQRLACRPQLPAQHGSHQHKSSHR